MSNALAPVFSDDNSSVTVFRPTPWLWLPIALYALVLGGFFGSLVLDAIQNHWPLHDSIMMFAVLSGVTLLFAVPLATAQIRVDEEMLQWRTWLGWKSVPWRDVLDYFERTQRGQWDGSPTRCQVLTPVGSCWFDVGGPASWTHGTILQQVIQERAIKARAKQWGVLGARPEIDWPWIFDNKNFLTLWFLPCFGMVFGVLGTGLCFELAKILWTAMTAFNTEIGWAWGIASAVFLIPFALLALLYPVLLAGSLSLLIKRPMRQIILSEEGILYRDTKRLVRVTWPEVTRITTLFSDFRTSVETTQGSFDFPGTMRDYYALKAALKAFIDPSVAAQWRNPDQTNRRMRRRNETGRAGVGIYTYRLAHLHLVLLTLTVIPLACYFPTVFDFSPETPLRLTFSHGGALALSLLPALVGWLAYFTASIVVDDQGITQQIFFRKKRLLWPDVQRVEASGADPFRRIRIFGAGASIGYLGLIEEGEQLAAEIQRRTGIAFSD